ncbi:hypothetical protein B0A49_03813 [Cryomyces minteri]|uniref:DUF4385 domain-containing protein n=1 Tax=Cryomyces minteri TaxID=331657 RepID=A0A4V5NHN1_9PEZI|nr:hypothetical protein B0A49_03813 [Cryomyces minteri]
MASAATDKALRMSYRIGRGEQGVLTFEPYKSALLPLWRFRTVAIAKQSSAELWARFVAYDEAADFVGMDMCRKFVQMGMTRAKRYANHKGGRKYVKGTPLAVKSESGNGQRYVRGTGVELPKGEDFAGREEKLRASEVFKKVWVRCREHEGYVRRKEEFLAEQKVWDRERKKTKVEKGEEEEVQVKEEVKVEEE